MSYEYIKNKIDNREIILLDGGTGSEIERQGVTMNDLAWCGIAHMDNPVVVRKVHESYIEAGADIIIANTFSTAPHVISRLGLEDQIIEINQDAVKIAQQARENSGREVCVAASMSSIPAFDSSRIPTGNEFRAGYTRQAEFLADAGVDLIITEMMIDIDNASMVIEAANAVGIRVWIGFSISVNDDNMVTNYNDTQGFEFEHMSFNTMATKLLPLGCDAAGIMHTQVGHIETALGELTELWDGPVFAYAESGHFVAPSWKFENIISTDDYLEYALKWTDKGVQIIGDCCGIGPEHIKVLKARLPGKMPNPAI